MAKLPPRKSISESNLKKNLELEETYKKGRVVEVKLEDIVEPDFHDRKYIDRASILELSENIRTEGLIQPIVLRRLSNGKLERVVGFRRVEAVKLIEEMNTIPAIITEMSDTKAKLTMIVENMLREDVSIYHETLGVIKYLSIAMNIEDEDVIRLLNRFKNFNNHRIKELTQDEEKKYDEVSKLIKKTGKISIATLVDRLSTVLSMPELLKKELDKGSLLYSNAKILKQIKDEQTLKIAIERVTKENMSKSETTILVNELLSTENDPKEKRQPNTFKQRLKELPNINTDGLSENKKTEVDKKIKAIDNMMKEIFETLQEKI